MRPSFPIRPHISRRLLLARAPLLRRPVLGAATLAPRFTSLRAPPSPVQPAPHGLTSRLVSSRRQARQRRPEPWAPSCDPAGRRASVAGRRLAGRRPAPRPTLLPCAAMLRSFRRTTTAAATRQLAPRPPGSRRPALPCSPVRFPPPPCLVAGPLSQFPKVCQAISPKFSNPNR